jgi:hypothetical protein
VHEIEIDMVEPELVQARIEGTTDRVGAEILVPDLRRDVKLAARQASPCMRKVPRPSLGMLMPCVFRLSMNRLLTYCIPPATP